MISILLRLCTFVMWVNVTIVVGFYAITYAMIIGLPLLDDRELVQVIIDTIRPAVEMTLRVGILLAVAVVPLALVGLALKLFYPPTWLQVERAVRFSTMLVWSLNFVVGGFYWIVAIHFGIVPFFGTMLTQESGSAAYGLLAVGTPLLAFALLAIVFYWLERWLIKPTVGKMTT